MKMDTILEIIAHGIRAVHKNGLSRNNMLILVNSAGMDRLKEEMNGDSSVAVTYVSRVFDIPVELNLLVEDELMIVDRRKYYESKKAV